MLINSRYTQNSLIVPAHGFVIMHQGLANRSFVLFQGINHDNAYVQGLNTNTISVHSGVFKC